ncbi:MAG: hypothetical protein AVDCRST_MAG49-1710, partial [uncultured Thermomicrobiales bacterium]
ACPRTPAPRPRRESFPARSPGRQPPRGPRRGRRGRGRRRARRLLRARAPRRRPGNPRDADPQHRRHPAPHPPVAALRAPLRHLVRPVRQGLGRRQRRRGDRRPRQHRRHPGRRRRRDQRRRGARPRRAHRPPAPTRGEPARPDRRRHRGQQPPRRPDRGLPPHDVQPDDQPLLRLLPRLGARPGQLPAHPLGADRQAERSRHLAGAPRGRPADLRGTGHPDGDRDVQRDRLQHGQPVDGLELRRLGPGRERERRPQLPGDGRRGRVHDPALPVGDDPRGLRLAGRLQQPAPDRRPGLLHPQLDLGLPDRPAAEPRRRQRRLLHPGADRPQRRGPRQRPRPDELHDPCPRRVLRHGPGVLALPRRQLRPGRERERALPLPGLGEHHARPAGRGRPARQRPVRLPAGQQTERAQGRRELDHQQRPPRSDQRRARRRLRPVRPADDDGQGRPRRRRARRRRRRGRRPGPPDLRDLGRPRPRRRRPGV